MAGRREIKIISFKKRNDGRVSLNLDLGGERAAFDVSVVDRNGIFGLEFPDTLGLKLRRFPPEESRNLIDSVKRRYTAKLRAA